MNQRWLWNDQSTQKHVSAKETAPPCGCYEKQNSKVWKVQYNIFKVYWIFTQPEY